VSVRVCVCKDELIIDDMDHPKTALWAGYGMTENMVATLSTLRKGNLFHPTKTISL